MDRQFVSPFLRILVFFEIVQHLTLMQQEQYLDMKKFEKLILLQSES